MAIRGEEVDGERPGDDDRSLKRLRLASLVEENEDVSATRMATIGNDFEDVITEAQSETPKSSQSVKLQSSDVLDCPTCCEPLMSTIYQVLLL